MPCSWAMPHMMAGVTAPPRWQWSSASGIRRGSWRTIAQSIATRCGSGMDGRPTREAIGRDDELGTERTRVARISDVRLRRHLEIHRGPIRMQVRNPVATENVAHVLHAFAAAATLRPLIPGSSWRVGRRAALEFQEARRNRPVSYT